MVSALLRPSVAWFQYSTQRSRMRSSFSIEPAFGSSPGRVTNTNAILKSFGAPASANTKANEQLPAEDMGRQIHADQEAIKRLQFMAPLTDEERQTFSDMWTEVKAEFAK